MNNKIIQEIIAVINYRRFFDLDHEQINSRINNPEFIDTVNIGVDCLNDMTVNEFWTSSQADDTTKRIICQIYTTRQKNALITKQKQQYGHIQPLVSNKFAVGAILWASWGYEQTNNDYYVIVEQSKSFVKLLPLSNNYKENGFMSGNSKAGKEIDFSVLPIKRKVKEHGITYIAIEDYKHAWLYDGKEKSESHYA
jgi:hypothetical protein